MKITKNSLELAVGEQIISREQADKLFSFLKSLPSTGPSFDFTHVLYYMGGLGLVTVGASAL